ncbi:inositol hexakisphosphate and diphosphoinositol-pentakisphosphate kinase 1-like [Sinocyclocheilus rhinocerous]|uniref:inositol hexakisphosphate and diphosphoinositol-pentakisphosphate kinase 1-like n=1 Tax=Sinocyclocheilus rhinocerous TaxID=307959 RepID=UPI0007B84E0A|nr:PREDICTED: inositol hexakisphosphate and diphosphoinositol-pentakisphosphate kinase 1-like [Sinocyclocheilus rhinocerous]
MSKSSGQGMCNSELPRFLIGSEGGESRELDDIDMRKISGHYREEEEEDEDQSERQIMVGICSMMKKSKSKPMTEILERLCKFEYITVDIFPEEVILNEPVEKWPLCDCLISFHSKGFPLDKAVSYAKLRNPLLINDLNMQYFIQDRREVYRILQEEGIDLPRYAVLNRDPDRPEECNLVESEDHVEVNGEVFHKPFVEKPVSAEDHNVYIYYPTSAGGGSQRLFRKIGSRSSVYSPESTVRKTGSYIYEEFMPTDGTDVKVYTVGPDYAHAEARKSPALDGKVERDSEGKEIRYPVMLTAMEKLVARKVCLAFKQTVCGFDLLRANGHSFVCDVNGFSFVKNSMKYYDDCAKVLGNMVMRELAPQLHIPWSIPMEAEDIPIVPTTSGTMMELRCVIAVIRHGDRTPKQKMKMEVRNALFFELFEKYGGYKSGKLKLKKPKQLQEVLDIARQLLAELVLHNDCEIEEKKSKLEQLKTVLEMYGHFSGINRKVQLTYLPNGQPKASSEEEDALKEGPSLLLVLKWGGELTPAGRVQAEELGRAFRCMYPGGQGDYAGFPGCGLLRLHSTYRHDLKIYASDEGRVQMTAAAFAKGLLALEGELTPILVQMVKSANMNGLLDSDSDSLTDCQQRVKARLHEIMQKNKDFNEEDYSKLASTGSPSLVNSMEVIVNPVSTCDRVHTLIKSLTCQICKRLEDPKSADLQLYHSETLELMLQRWSKLERDFRMKNGRYDISKIPDIYDCVKYDTQHNSSLGLEDTLELFRLSRALADIIIPQEYGINKAEKLDIASAYCLPLVKKIQLDLQRTHEDEAVNKLHPLYYNHEKQTNPGSLEDLSQDEPDRAALTEPISIQRKSPLIRGRKAGSMEALSESNTSSRGLAYRIFPSSSRQSPEIKPSGLGAQCAGLFSASFPNLRDLSRVPRKKLSSLRNRSSQTGMSQTHTHTHTHIGLLFPFHLFLCLPRIAVPGHLISLSVANLHLLHPFSPFCPHHSLSPVALLNEHQVVKLLAGLHHLHRCSYHLRLLLAGQKPPECLSGFEGCSLVPSIYPLETLHNSLSLKQVDEFLTTLCKNGSETQFKRLKSLSAMFESHSQPSLDVDNQETPISTPVRNQPASQSLWYASGPPSTVSSAGPSSPSVPEPSSNFRFNSEASLAGFS